MKNAKLLLLTVVLLLTLTGCRTRTTVPVDPIPDENGETAEDQLGQTDRAEEAESDSAAEEDVRPDADAPTATDPDSDRKTYAEDADAEIVHFFTAQDENTIWTMLPKVIEALK